MLEKVFQRIADNFHEAESEFIGKLAINCEGVPDIRSLGLAVPQLPKGDYRVEQQLLAEFGHGPADGLLTVEFTGDWSRYKRLRSVLEAQAGEATKPSVSLLLRPTYPDALAPASTAYQARRDVLVQLDLGRIEVTATCARRGAHVPLGLIDSSMSSAARALARRSRLSSGPRLELAFELCSLPRGDIGYGLALFRTGIPGGDGGSDGELVVRIWGNQVRGIVYHVLATIRCASYRTTDLKPTRRPPFRLAEEDGVRLGLPLSRAQTPLEAPLHRGDEPRHRDYGAGRGVLLVQQTNGRSGSVSRPAGTEDHGRMSESDGGV